MASFANGLNPAAFMSQPGQHGAAVNFSTLDLGGGLRPFGMYGHKRCMVEYLAAANFISEAAAKRLVADEGSLAPGLYAVVRSGPLPAGGGGASGGGGGGGKSSASDVALIYWHAPAAEAELFKAPCRRFVSCNFVRYLTELCPRVLAFADGAVARAMSLAPSVSAAPQAQRSTRLKVSLAHVSEDDVQLFPGASVPLTGLAISDAKSSSTLFLGSDYLHSFAGVVESVEAHTCRVTETTFLYADGLDRWLAKHELATFSKLPNADFERLLAGAGNGRLALAREKLRSLSAGHASAMAALKADAARTLQNAKNDTATNVKHQVATASRSVLHGVFGDAELVDEFGPMPSDRQRVEVAQMGQAARTIPVVMSQLLCIARGIGPEDLSRRSAIYYGGECHLASQRLGHAGSSFASPTPGSPVVSIVPSAGPPLDAAAFIIEKLQKPDDRGPVLYGDAVVLRLSGSPGVVFSRDAFTAAVVLRDPGLYSDPRDPWVWKLVSSGEPLEGPVAVGDSVCLTPAFQWGVTLCASASDISTVIMYPKPAGVTPAYATWSLLPKIPGADSGMGWLRALLAPLTCLQQNALVATVALDEKLATDNPGLLKSLHRRFLGGKHFEAEFARQAMEEGLKFQASQIADSGLDACWWKEKVDTLRAGIAAGSAALHPDVAAALGAAYLSSRQKVVEAVAETVVGRLNLPRHMDNFQMRKVKALEARHAAEKDTLLAALKAEAPPAQADAGGFSAMRLLSCAVQGYYQLQITYEVEKSVGRTLHVKIAELSFGQQDAQAAAKGGVAPLRPILTPLKASFNIDPAQERLLLFRILSSKCLLVMARVVAGKTVTEVLVGGLGAKALEPKCIKLFPTGFDLLAFDASLQRLAFYDRGRQRIDLYGLSLGPSGAKLDRTEVEIDLSKFAGCTDLLWMDFVPGQDELLLIDASQRARVLELGRVMLKPRCIELLQPFRLAPDLDPALSPVAIARPSAAAVSPDGSCLFIFSSGGPSAARPPLLMPPAWANLPVARAPLLPSPARPSTCTFSRACGTSRRSAASTQGSSSSSATRSSSGLLAPARLRRSPR